MGLEKFAKKNTDIKFSIIKGIELKNLRLLIYGVEGIGKSTFSSYLPEPLIIDTEDRTRHINCNKLIVKNWDDTIYILRNFDNIINENKVNVKTIVIDTLDWLQKLATDHVCKVRKVESIEEFGYGKGYVYIYEYMMDILKQIDKLNEKYNICLVCHSVMKKFEDPFGFSYDRYTLKLLSGDKTSIADSFKEWCDYMFFMNYMLKNNTNDIIDERCIFTNRTSRFDGKRSIELNDVIVFNEKNAKELINLIVKNK